MLPFVCYCCILFLFLLFVKLRYSIIYDFIPTLQKILGHACPLKFHIQLYPLTCTHTHTFLSCGSSALVCHGKLIP